VGSGVRVESAEGSTGADVFDGDGALGETVYLDETFGDDVRGKLGTGVGAWSRVTEPFIAFGPESSIAAPVRRAVEDARIEPGPVMQAQNIGAVAGLAAAGLGVTAVPELVLPMISFAGLVHIPLQPTVERTISLVQVAGRPQTTSTRSFVTMLLADV
jgi:DNA-binding transcriptional LysR family regulator